METNREWAHQLLRTLFFALLILGGGSTFSQDRVITGTVRSPDETPVPYATVSLRPVETSRVIGFTSTDPQGKFSLKVPQAHVESHLEIMVSHINHGRMTILLTKSQTVYDIILEKQDNVIDSVAIQKSAKVSQKGDTINYNVEVFSQGEDRSIGDVLRRMPGFDVADNGLISFNNKPISNFYIDGDDLLGGKYGLGSKTIPHDMVRNVNVYTGHEHIKVNRDKYNSDKVAINLEIKDEAKLKLNGMAKVGAGMPKKYDSDVNTILLNKRFKMLNALKGNNVGEDLSIDIIDLYMGAARASKLVSHSTISPPAVRRRRHFMNNSGMFTANNSHRFQNDLFVRTNVNALIQKRDLRFEGANHVFMEGETIALREYQQGHLLSKSLAGDLYAEMNQSTYYLKNDLKFELETEDVPSAMTNSATAFEQLLYNKSHSLSNNLHYTPTLKNKDMLSIDWAFTQKRTPQQLTFDPGILERVLNNGQAYHQLHQNTGLDLLSNVLKANYRLRNRKIEQTYGADIGHRRQILTSHISLVDTDGNNHRYKDGRDDNHLRLHEYNASVYSRYRYKKNNSQLSVTVPVRYSYVTYREDSFDQHGQKSFVLLEPSVSLEQQLNPQDKVSLHYNLTNTINDIGTLYQGPIVLNHRTVQQNDSFELWNEKVHSFMADYSIKRPLKMFFTNISGNYIIRQSDLLNTTIFDNDVQQQARVDYANQVRIGGIAASVSKYIFALATTVSLKTGWSTTAMENFYNGQLYDLTSDNYNLSATLDFQLFKAVNVSQKLDFNHLKSKSTAQLAGATPNRFNSNQLRGSTNLTYAVHTNAYLKATVESVHVDQKSASSYNYYFADVNATWKIPRFKSELELNVYNLLNTDTLRTLSIHSNGFIENVYRLNPRTAVLKYIFNF